MLEKLMTKTRQEITEYGRINFPFVLSILHRFTKRDVKISYHLVESFDTMLYKPKLVTDVLKSLQERRNSFSDIFK